MGLKYRPPGESVQTLKTKVEENEHVTFHTIADGDDETAGAKADAAVVTDAAGSLSAKLRGIVKMLADVWDTATHSIKVKVSGVTATLDAGDLEIGAVEIKNSTDDTRATVGANGLYAEVRASALPTGAATSAKQDTGNASLALLIPAPNCDEVTPHDGTDLTHNTRGLMVSTEGNVKVSFVTTGSEIILTGLKAGVVYPFQVKRVWETDTTATGILALY